MERMTLAEIISLELQLGRERRACDGNYGRAMQILHQLEAEWRERQRDERLTCAERQSMGATK